MPLTRNTFITIIININLLDPEMSHEQCYTSYLINLDTHFKFPLYAL
jgi:hypothetical protein